MLRGMVGEEITITGPSLDLHSGMYGGPAINPIRVLTRALADLHDENGRITLPGFYDGVEELSDEVRDQWRSLDHDGDKFLQSVGLSTPAGETDYSVLEQIWARPTCDVNGIIGGYTGEGFKTVLPSTAQAKISFRLVGKQDPLKIQEALYKHIEDRLPPDCTVSYKSKDGSPRHRHAGGCTSVSPGATGIKRRMAERRCVCRMRRLYPCSWTHQGHTGYGQSISRLYAGRRCDSLTERKVLTHELSQGYS